MFNSKEYYQKNKERLKEKSRIYREENIEQRRKCGREYSRIYYLIYPEKVKAANKRWQEAHPEYRAQYREKHRAKVNKYSREWERQKRKKLAMV